MDNLIRELDALRDKGPLDPNHPPPPGFEREATFLWRDDRESAAKTPSDSLDYLSEDDRAKRLVQIEEDRKREREERAPFVQWCQAERERYAMRRGQAEQQAMANAESRVPKTMDIALLGGGWSFLLEFSTVIVILFILLCLGILNAITGRDSITILASIAGYVLGKASANAQRGHALDGQAATSEPAARPVNAGLDLPTAGHQSRPSVGHGHV